MAMAQHLTKAQTQINGDILEKVIIANDLAGLSPFEKVSHIKNVCESLGLNPLTKPIQLIKFQGKEIMYVTKDATEQLRKNHNVSITSIENKIMQGIYVVTAHASTPDGRTDASTGAITIEGLKGDNLCNALLKAETKAKRRVTLSICGLGFIDESEVESMAGARKIDHTKTESLKVIAQDPIIEPHDIEKDLLDISWTNNLADLQDTYTTAYKHWANAKHKENLAKVMDAKDKRKLEIEELLISEKADPITGEIA